MRRTSIPESRAASGLPPTAYIHRPSLVRLNTKPASSAATTSSQIDHFTPSRSFVPSAAKSSSGTLSRNDAIASQKYDVFLLKAVSGPPIMPCARQAIAAGIPVVVRGSPPGPQQTTKPQVDGISGSVVTLFTTDRNTIADLTDKPCKQQKATPCKVIYLFGPLAFDGASVTRKAFLDRVKARYPDIQVVATGTPNYDPDQSSSLLRQLLQRHKDVNVIANDCEPCSIASVNVLKNLGLEAKVLLTTEGGSKPGTEAVKRGEIFASAVLLPASEARDGYRGRAQGAGPQEGDRRGRGP
jgi:ABC-type sugar transport system substrate-binding protein